MLIVISGKGRSGKDTAATIIKGLFESKNETCITIAYADFLKEILGKCFNLSEEQLYGSLKEYPIEHMPIRTRSGKVTNHLWTTRKLLQFLGTDVLRTIDPDCWVNVVKNMYFTTSYDNFVITDARFENEVAWALELGGTHVHITRENKEYVGNSDHASENSIKVSDKCYCVENNKDLTHLTNLLTDIINKEISHG